MVAPARGRGSGPQTHASTHRTHTHPHRIHTIHTISPPSTSTSIHLHLPSTTLTLTLSISLFSGLIHPKTPFILSRIIPAVQQRVFWQSPHFRAVRHVGHALSSLAFGTVHRQLVHLGLTTPHFPLTTTATKLRQYDKNYLPLSSVFLTSAHFEIPFCSSIPTANCVLHLVFRSLGYS